MRIVRGPGSALGSILRSAKRYVPASLTFTPLATRPTPALSILAPMSPFPRTMTRTGSREWPGHQLGGSTFRISGPPGGVAQRRKATTKRAAKGFMRRRAYTTLTLAPTGGSVSFDRNAPRRPVFAPHAPQESRFRRGGGAHPGLRDRCGYGHVQRREGGVARAAALRACRATHGRAHVTPGFRGPARERDRVPGDRALGLQRMEPQRRERRARGDAGGDRHRAVLPDARCHARRRANLRPGGLSKAGRGDRLRNVEAAVRGRPGDHRPDAPAE